MYWINSDITSYFIWSYFPLFSGNRNIPNLITACISESLIKEYRKFLHDLSFFCFVNKRASYPFGIISLAHAPVNVTDFSIGSINCNPNNADRGRSIIRAT
jgi:hypothetical protein